MHFQRILKYNWYYYSSKVNIDVEELIGYGIIGMAIVFVTIWSFLKIKGLKND